MKRDVLSGHLWHCPPDTLQILHLLPWTKLVVLAGFALSYCNQSVAVLSQALIFGCGMRKGT